MADEAQTVTLAHKWEEGKKNVDGWFISEKLDGVRAYWSGHSFFSRNGNRFDAPKWFTEALPSKPLDGELWCGRGMFQDAISIVRKQGAGDRWKNVTYYVFDAVLNSTTYEKRMDYVRSVIGPGKTPYAAVVGNLKCKNVGHLQEELKKVEEKGGEGLMLRKPGSMYERGRSHCLLKVKTFNDEEAIITGHQPGSGRNSHRMGALFVETPDKRCFKIGTGFSDAQRNKPPKVGTIVTYRYQELTNSGIPRFPSYVGPRIDMTWSRYCKDYLPPAAKKPRVLKKAKSILYSDPADSNNDGSIKRTHDHANDDQVLDSPQRKVAKISTDSEDSKPPCTYGANCYRSNKEHLDAFWHPPKFGRSLSSHNLRQPVDPTCPKCDKQLLLQRGENSDDKLKEHIEEGCPSLGTTYVPPSYDAITLYSIFLKPNAAARKDYILKLTGGVNTIGRQLNGLEDARLSRKHVEFDVDLTTGLVMIQSLGMTECEHKKPNQQYFKKVQKGESIKAQNGDFIRFLPISDFEYKVEIVKIDR